MNDSLQTTPKLETLCKGIAFPEGPIAMPDGSLLCVEIQG